MQSGLLLQIIHITKRASRPFDQHMVSWYLGFRFKLVLRNFQHVLVLVWDKSVRCHCAAIIVFHRCATEVLLMSLIVELLSFANHVLL